MNSLVKSVTSLQMEGQRTDYILFKPDLNLCLITEIKV